jgi:shikimate kinase
MVLPTKALSSNIFLVGPMGVGKTTIGRQLASRLNLTFKDSDREIEEQTGASISLIFEIEGEPGFRKREQAMIAKLTAQENIILSTGGGAVLDERNRTHLKNRGCVIYLQASVAELLNRTAYSRNRPLLLANNPSIQLEKIMNERHSLYEEVADVTINTDKHPIRQVVKLVLKQLQTLNFK